MTSYAHLAVATLALLALVPRARAEPLAAEPRGSDGERGFTPTNLGVVPLLRVRGRYVFDNALFLESELDGCVSPVPTTGPFSLGLGLR